MYQIAADSMPPRHVAPLGAKWVVLKEQMIDAVTIDQAVRIIQPAASGCEVKLRTKRLVIGNIRSDDGRFSAVGGSGPYPA